jgi:xylulokinase
LQAVIGGLVDLPVVVADVDQAVATGAAVQAAAAHEGTDHGTIQRRWGLGSGTAVEVTVESGDLRERYAALRDQTV